MVFADILQGLLQGLLRRDSVGNILCHGGRQVIASPHDHRENPLLFLREYMGEFPVDVGLHLIGILQLLPVDKLRPLIGEHELRQVGIHVQIGILVQYHVLRIIDLLQAVGRYLLKEHAPDVLAACPGKLVQVVRNAQVHHRDEVRPFFMKHADDAHDIRNQGRDSIFLDRLLDEVEGFVGILRSVGEFPLQPVHAGHDLDAGDMACEDTLYIPADLGASPECAEILKLRMCFEQLFLAFGDPQFFRLFKEVPGIFIGKCDHRLRVVLLYHLCRMIAVFLQTVIQNQLVSVHVGIVDSFLFFPVIPEVGKLHLRPGTVRIHIDRAVLHVSDAEQRLSVT